MIRKIAGIFALLIFSISCESGAQQPPKPERFTDAVTSVVKWFTDLQKYYEANQVDPAAKEQSIRYLKKLRNSLSDLEIDKQSFTEALKTAKLPQDEQDLSKKAETLKSSVWGLRKKLQDYTEILPSNFQTAANKLETDLSNGLVSKCHSLDDIAVQLTGQANIDRAQLVSSGEQTVKMIQDLEAKVSELITQLSK